VIAAFFTFAPSMVTRALPGVWQRVSPQRALEVRLAGAVDALTPLAAAVPPVELAEAVELLEAAVDRLNPAGHVLGAANAALPRPDGWLGRLWQASTTLREHRGDGHVAALVTAGLDGCQAAALRTGIDLPRELMQQGRGWSDEQWQSAVSQLVGRGWLRADGTATPLGIQGYERIEAITDELAAVPWNALGSAATARLAALLTPLATACHAVLPTPNPVGVPVPSERAAEPDIDPDRRLSSDGDPAQPAKLIDDRGGSG
jgi:hypothetical protein